MPPAHAPADRYANAMNLVGKTREQITYATKDLSREELIEVLYRHVTIEPHFKVSEIGKARRITKDAVMARLRTGEIPPPTHRPLENSYRIPLSSIRSWDESTAIDLTTQRNGH